MANIELKNCPFCGSDSLQCFEREEYSSVKYSVTCLRCSARGPSTIQSLEIAINLWNNRAKKVKINKHARPYYYICSDCASNLGGKVVPYPITVTHGICPYCSKDQESLIPITDFKWPDGTNPIWD